MPEDRGASGAASMFAAAAAAGRPVVVTGADGQLAHAMLQTFGQHWRVVGLPRRDLDITSGATAHKELVALRPSAIVNCAAYNRVDDAEDEAAIALSVNALAVRTLARAAADSEAALVHYSTDFVFDGETTRPYSEDDEVHPLGLYGASKMLGEWFARDAPQHYVLRVESLFGSLRHPRGSVDKMIAAIERGDCVRAFVDRIVSPSYVFDVAAATSHLLASDAPPGVYHCVNRGHCTWYELAQDIARRAGRESSVFAVTMAEVPLRTPRPRYAALSTAKLERLTGFAPATWQDAIHRHLTSRGWAHVPVPEPDRSQA